MERQLSFAQSEYAGKRRNTRRDKFLAEMERVVPWARCAGVRRQRHRLRKTS